MEAVLWRSCAFLVNICKHVAIIWHLTDVPEGKAAMINPGSCNPKLSKITPFLFCSNIDWHRCARCRFPRAQLQAVASRGSGFGARAQTPQHLAVAQALTIIIYQHYHISRVIQSMLLPGKYILFRTWSWSAWGIPLAHTRGGRVKIIIRKVRSIWANKPCQPPAGQCKPPGPSLFCWFSMWEPEFDQGQLGLLIPFSLSLSFSDSLCFDRKNGRDDLEPCSHIVGHVPLILIVAFLIPVGLRPSTGLETFRGYCTIRKWDEMRLQNNSCNMPPEIMGPHQMPKHVTNFAKSYLHVLLDFILPGLASLLKVQFGPCWWPTYNVFGVIVGRYGQSGSWWRTSPGLVWTCVRVSKVSKKQNFGRSAEWLCGMRSSNAQSQCKIDTMSQICYNSKIFWITKKETRHFVSKMVLMFLVWETITIYKLFKVQLTGSDCSSPFGC